MTLLIAVLGVMVAGSFAAWTYVKGFDAGYALGVEHGRETERAVPITRNPQTSLTVGELDKLARSLGPNVRRSDVLDMWS